ncbi:hypothetical protein GN956_G21616 [Arapaima gigas]
MSRPINDEDSSASPPSRAAAHYKQEKPSHGPAHEGDVVFPRPLDGFFYHESQWPGEDGKRPEGTANESEGRANVRKY